MEPVSKRIQRLREQLGGGNDWMLTVIFRDGSRKKLDLPDCFYLILDDPGAVERIECPWNGGGILRMMNSMIDEAKPSSEKEPK